MIRVLIYLIFMAALAAGAVWLAERPGEISVLWQGYRIETSIAVGAIAIVALLLVLMLVWSIIRFVFGLPGAFGLSNRVRRREKGMSALSRGMVAVGAGDAVSAQRYAAQARKLTPEEPLTLLLDAQTAQMAGDRAAAEASFRAMLDRSETRVLGLRGLFVEARRRGDAEAAQSFADEAVKLSPSIPWANDALLQFHSATGNWSAARTAVERRAALKLADKAEARRQRAVLLAAEALQKQDSEPETALSAALEAVKLAPGLVPAAALAGRLLANRGDARKASRLLEAAWRENPHPDLASAYLNARAKDGPQEKLARAEALAKLKPTDPESALTIAAAAIPAKAYDKARAALAPLIAGAPTMRACLLMAELEEAEHGPAGRVREWLTRATRALRDPAWVAEGLVSNHWLPASPASGELDAFIWTTPPVALGSTGPVIEDEPPLPPAAPQEEAMALPPSSAPESAVSAEPLAAVDILPPAPAGNAPAASTPAFDFAHAPDDPGPKKDAEPVRRKRFGLFG